MQLVLVIKEAGWIFTQSSLAFNVHYLTCRKSPFFRIFPTQFCWKFSETESDIFCFPCATHCKVNSEKNIQWELTKRLIKKKVNKITRNVGQLAVYLAYSALGLYLKWGSWTDWQYIGYTCCYFYFTGLVEITNWEICVMNDLNERER